MNSHKTKTLIFAYNYWFLTPKKLQNTHFCDAVLINKYCTENIIKTAENYIRQIEGKFRGDRFETTSHSIFQAKIIKKTKFCDPVLITKHLIQNIVKPQKTYANLATLLYESGNPGDHTPF